MVSAILMFQSTIRLSISSIAGSDVPRRRRGSTSSSVQPAPGSVVAQDERRPRPRPAGSSSGRASRPARSVGLTVHVGEQVAVVRLVDAHHLLHRLRRERRPCGRTTRGARRRAAAGCSAPLDLVRRRRRRRCRSGLAQRRDRDAGLARRPRRVGDRRDRTSSESMAPIVEPVTVLRHERPLPARDEVDVVVVGAGGAGMCAALAAAQAGPGHRPGREERLLRRLHRAQRRRRLDARQLRRSGRPARSPPTTWRRPSATSTRSSATWSRRSAATPTSTAVPRCSTSSTTHTPVRFQWVPQYADYHPEAPGGRAAGRSCEPVPLDARFLGDELDRLHPQYTKAPANLIVTQADFRKISLGLRTWRGPVTMVKVLVNRRRSAACCAAGCTPWATRSRSACARG